MAISFDKNLIQRSFSSSASRYDQLTALQQDIGNSLLRWIAADHRAYSKILDIGMGTGWLTTLLAKQFPEAHVYGLDFSDGMVDFARKQCQDISIFQADARQLPLKKESVDLILSNSAFQWVENLEDAFVQCRQALKKEGMFFFSMFARDSLDELFESLEYALAEKKIRRPYILRRLPSKEKIFESIEMAGFSKIETKQETMRVWFPDMFALMKWLKDIGANGMNRNLFIGRDRLLMADGYYKNHYQKDNRIYASFEVVWVKTEK